MLGYGHDESAPTPFGVFVGCFCGRSLIFLGVFATSSFCVRYVFAEQKYGFCCVKVWFLACKKGVFALQKYGFCFSNVMLLQIGRTHFVVECEYLTECLAYYSN